MDSFNEWSKICEVLQSKEIDFFFNKQEIWIAHYGFNIGFEQNGKNQNFERPVLIYKKISKEMFLGMPLTTKYNGEYYKFPIGKMNEKENFVIWEQLKLMISKRLMYKIGYLDDKFFKQIRAIIKDYL